MSYEIKLGFRRDGSSIFDPPKAKITELFHFGKQANPNAFFQCAEQTIYTSGNSGAWSVSNEERVLTMSSTGASGCMRFTSDTGEGFTATFGVDQNLPWCDIVPNLTPEETALVIHPQYYKQPDRIAVREMHHTRRIVTNAQGRKIAIQFFVDEGHHLKANLVVG